MLDEERFDVSMDALAAVSPAPICFDTIPCGRNGCYEYKGNKIYISWAISPAGGADVILPHRPGPFASGEQVGRTQRHIQDGVRRLSLPKAFEGNPLFPLEHTAGAIIGQRAQLLGKKRFHTGVEWWGRRNPPRPSPWPGVACP